MKIATYNVNGINGRLPVLIRWLKLARPDIVAVQELKTAQNRYLEIELRGFERLEAHLASLIGFDAPVVISSDFNVTDLDVCA